VGFCGGGTPLFSANEIDNEVAWLSPQSEYAPIGQAAMKCSNHNTLNVTTFTAEQAAQEYHRGLKTPCEICVKVENHESKQQLTRFQ
jgi:hypothetical protein